RPDIIVLDLGLPSLDGFEVLRQIREEEEETPILVLTGRRDAKDLLRCFNLGTDDFLPKPFEFRELSVRIRAILRRAGKRHREEAEPRVQVEGLNLDPETYEVSWRGQSVRLTPTEFRILYLLATNAGHVVPASRLYTYVWGSEGGDANALRSHISHIRRKLEIDGSGPGKITSVPAVGYVLRPDAPSVPASAAPPSRSGATGSRTSCAPGLLARAGLCHRLGGGFGRATSDHNIRAIGGRSEVGCEDHASGPRSAWLPE